MKAINVCLPIICLLVISCKKEEKSNGFTIDAPSSYNQTDYAIYNEIPISHSGGTKHYNIDIDSDGNNDFDVFYEFTWLHQSTYFLYYYNKSFKPVNLAEWEFSVVSDTSTVLLPHHDGDVVNGSIIWKPITGDYTLYFRDDPSAEQWWNQQDPTGKYILFRKIVAGGYKYGYCKQNNDTHFGPIVMER